MTIAIRTLSMLVLAGALSACGLLSGLIPDQEVSDPFRLDGARVTLAADTDEVTTLDGPAVGSVVGTIDGVFEVDDNELPSWIADAVRIRSVSGGIGLEPLVTLNAPDGADLPQALTIVGASIAFEVSSGGNARFGGEWSSGELEVVLSATEPCSSTCTYVVTPSDEALLTVLITGSEARAYGQLVATPGEYELEGEVRLDLDVDLPDGTTVAITLKDFGGVVSF